MTARAQSTDDPPRRTPSFVCEVPLRVTRAQERTLLTRLEAARQVYNACLGEARTRVRLVRESKAFQRARTLPREDPERKQLFAQARAQHAFSEYALHAFAKPLGHSWLGEHLDSLTIQKLATRAYGAANRPAFSTLKPPCWRRVRPKVPGDVGNPSCRRPTSTPSLTNARVDGIGCPPLVSPRLIRVRARRLRQVGQLTLRAGWL